MPQKPPRFLPTLALAALWLALYALWVAVRPTEPAAPTQSPGRAAATSSSTTTTTAAPLFRLKP